jgi:hypothetical protein
MLLLACLCLIGASGGLCCLTGANDGLVDVDLPVSLAAFFSLANSFSSSLTCTQEMFIKTVEEKNAHMHIYSRREKCTQ